MNQKTNEKPVAALQKGKKEKKEEKEKKKEKNLL